MEMRTILLVVATLACCRHHDTVDALVLSPITPRSSIISWRGGDANTIKKDSNNSRSTNYVKRRTTHQLYATRNHSSSNISSLSTKEEALQLIKENTLSSDNDGDEDCNRLSPYDDETIAPIESEFHSLMSTFLTYSQSDIQSMTSTSNQYLNYKPSRHQSLHKESPGEHESSNKRPRQRSKEEGIRYRTLYSGVQAASLEPAVLRSFTVLFEDYLPIRIAGRRIYKHLKNVMKEVRLERIGEIERAREVCSGWDWSTKEDDGEQQHFIEHARCIWDILMDESLLLDDSMQLDGDISHNRETGFIPFHHLIHLGLDQVLMQFQLVTDRAKLDFITKQIMIEEGPNRDTEPGTLDLQRDDSISFVAFMRVLYHFTLTSGSQIANDQASLIKLLQTIKETAMSASQRHNAQDTSTLLAATAIRCGSVSKNRQKHSDQFDHYVSTFVIWESKFLGGDDARLAKQPPRRLDILRGCFEGARNAKVVAALKIVYMGKRDVFD